MKKLLFAFILFLPVSLMAGTYDDIAKELLKKIPQKDKTKTIAVMPFSSDKQFASDARIAEEEMTKALIDAGAQLSERSQIDKLLKEQTLKQSGLLTDEDAGEVGQGLGAKYVIIGTVTKIDKYGEEGNIGLRINARLVASANYKIIASASGEVAAGDASSNYKRKGPRKAVEYPQFLEIYGGMTLFDYEAHCNESIGKIEEEMKPGISAGLRLVRENTGFYTSCWEFLYSYQKFDNNSVDLSYTIYQISWIPTLRIPLWTYINSLPDYTSISIGYAFGLGISNLDYKNNIGEKDDSASLGICSSAILGIRLGLTDSVSVFTDIRYAPYVGNRYIFRRQDIAGKDSVWVRDGLYGPSVYFGLSLVP